MKQLQLTINKKQLSYPIVVGQNLFEKIQTLFELNKYTKVFVVTGENSATHFLHQLLNHLPPNTKYIILPPGEKAKNIDSVKKIWTAMSEAGLDRKSLAINLGGGVICDMGGFAASTYMRGIDFLQIPTTLLSQIDASIGGKTGIDFADIKNLIGVFNQPIGVLIDTQTLQTLPKREMVAGFAEIIKHGLIADKVYFEKVTSKKPGDFSDEEFIDIISRSCEIKKAIVEDDEMEMGKRKLINFGHTIGHAIESLSFETDRPLLHGETVSIGMVLEAKTFNSLGLLAEKDVETIEKTLSNAGLPTSLTSTKLPEIKDFAEEMLTKMRSDKKNEGGKINFTLLEKIGEGSVNYYVPEDVILKILKEDKE